MAYLLGVDTGGTYTDAVVIDDATQAVIAKSKALTSRPDLSIGVSGAIDAALAEAQIPANQVGLVSLSTTLATNALVEGQGGRVALIFIGFDDAEFERNGLKDALGGDPLITLAGGHNHAGSEQAPLDLGKLRSEVAELPEGITGFAVASHFATRNSAHEESVREVLREVTGLPVTCSHELSSALGGPKRALTAVLNARLIGMIDRLIKACEAHLNAVGITARLMVVRGDGALISAELARRKPIETILSGPAASIEGARWLTDETTALVSDIGGTTTDVCLLRDGRPQIDPQGARVGPYRTMVEAVAMRTFGLGGDSEVHVDAGLKIGLRLGPRRIMPISLLATQAPELVHGVYDRGLASDLPMIDGGRFVIPLWSDTPPDGLDKREAAIAERLRSGPIRLGEAVTSRIEGPALGRLVTRGLVIEAGVTPSDAAHMLGLSHSWDRDAAHKALTLFARQRTGGGDKLAETPEALARMIIDQVTHQTTDCILQSAFSEDGRDFELPAAELARHPLTMAGLDAHSDIVNTQVSLAVPVIGLGASAKSYYGAVGDRLGTTMKVPDHADVANAIGAVVGHVTMQAKGTVTGAGPGRVVAHLASGPQNFVEADEAIAALEEELRASVAKDAAASGVDDPQFSVSVDKKSAEIENAEMFISADMTVLARGRPRIATE